MADEKSLREIYWVVTNSRRLKTRQAVMCGQKWTSNTEAQRCCGAVLPLRKKK
jgi:hypothetical protein